MSLYRVVCYHLHISLSMYICLHKNHKHLHDKKLYTKLKAIYRPRKIYNEHSRQKLMSLSYRIFRVHKKNTDTCTI